MFSSRVRHGFARNRLAQAIDQRRASGLPIVDLTLSNPTKAGFIYPPSLLASLARERALTYEPQPFGARSARQAVSNDFVRRGWKIAPERIVLTASTSEAYSFLLKLLCDPGDLVLAPRPSYPLIEHLADLDGVGLDWYGLEFHVRWSIDVASVRARMTSPADRALRAVIMISPNNPTGSIVREDEAKAIAEVAGANGQALIIDEVFADYPLADGMSLSTVDGVPLASATSGAALTFSLGGLSKTAGLPQMKLGWIGVTGPDALVEDAMERLEIIADAYLSVSTPVQEAAADLLREGASIRAQILNRVRNNLESLSTIVAAHPACCLLTPEAGWYAVVQIPAVKSEEDVVVDLLERDGILVHPGYFFDFEREAFLVFSLLPDASAFRPAVARVFDEVGRP